MDYFHIGIPKSGSTFIQHIIARDERIKYSRGDFHKSNYWSLDEQIVKNNHKPSIISNETLIVRGEGAKKINFILALERILSLNPNAEIIITIREQFSALKSMFKYRVRHGRYFDNISCWLDTDEGMDYYSILNYGAIVKTLLAFVEQHKIHIIFYEDLKGEPERFINSFYDIWGLKPKEQDIDLGSKNSGLSDKNCYRFNQLNFLPFTKNQKGRKLKGWLSRRLKCDSKNLQQFYYFTRQKEMAAEIARSNDQLLQLFPSKKAALLTHNYLLP